MLLLRGLIPRHVRLEHYVGAAIFGCVTSYYTLMPFLAEQQRRRLAGEGAQHAGLAPRFGAQRAPAGSESAPK